VLWGIAFYKGINLLLILAYVMLLLLAANALVARRQVRGIAVRRQLIGPVFAGEPADVALDVQCPGERLPLGIRIEDRGEAHTRMWFFDRLERRAVCRGGGTVIVPRRGWYAWNEARVVSGYPLGLVERSINGDAGRAVLVNPACGSLNRARFRRFLNRALPAASESRQPPRHHPSAQGEFHGLREYRPGDSPRGIHWRTSARRGILMVREFEDPPPNDLIVVFEPWLPTAGRIEESELARRRLEEAVSFAATLCGEWCRRAGDRLVLAVAGPADPVVVAGPTGPGLEALMLECLALVSGGPIAAEPLIRALAGRPLPAGPILFLSTRETTGGDELVRRLSRPVVALGMEELKQFDFYEPPPSSPLPAAERGQG
jgi:uncharacterized protein (DUF58 family)